MFLYLKCCFSEKLEQRSVDGIQKYADDTRTTCRRHVTCGFCPKMGEKKSGGAKMAKKKKFGGVTLNKTFFFLALSILNLGMIIRLPRTVLWVAVLFNVMLTPYFAAKIYCIILLLNVDLIPVHVVFPKINQIVFS
jgi:hypothetical protein